MSIIGGLIVVGLLGTGAWFWYNSPFLRTRLNALAQPVPFSHQHHVAGLGLDCRYCHTSVEESSFAGMPPTQTCMNCHSQIWANTEMLEPVRASFRDDVPLEWNRVHRLGDFVRFNHSIHVTRGIGCVSCHGRVDQMPLIQQEKPLTMSWCLECHRNPGKYIRPKDKVYDLIWEADNQEEQGAELIEEYQIRKLEHCSTCHY